MARKAVVSDQAPEALGPYSQAIVAGGLVFCSGMAGIDPATGEAAPSLSTSGETLTIEESMNLEGENGERRTCWRRARMEVGQRLRLLPPAAKTSLA